MGGGGIRTEGNISNMRRMPPNRPASSLHHRVAAGMKAELARRDILPTELSEHLGISERTFRRRINGEGRAFDCDEIDMAADFFGITPLGFSVQNTVRVGDLHVMASAVHVHERGL